MSDKIFGISVPDLSNMVPDYINHWFTSLQVAPHLLTTQSYLLPLSVAIAMGYLIGFERRLRHKGCGGRSARTWSLPPHPALSPWPGCMFLKLRTWVTHRVSPGRFSRASPSLVLV